MRDMSEDFVDAFNRMCDEAGDIREEHGFETSMENYPEKIALIHAEVSEALEDYRKDREDHIPKELADIVIRVMDLADGLDVDVGQAIVDKMEENREREGKNPERKI